MTAVSLLQARHMALPQAIVNKGTNGMDTFGAILLKKVSN